MEDPVKHAADVPIGQATLQLHEGDVTTRLGEVPVVSSDDNYLSHSGGVSAAIWSAAGGGLDRDPNVQAAQRDGARPRAGDVVVSRTASALVLHAVTLDFDRGERVTPERLMTLYQRVLDTAYDEHQSGLAVPLLGTGTAGIADAVSAVMLARAMTTRALLPLPLGVELWLMDAQTLSDVHGLVQDVARPGVRYADLAQGRSDDVVAAAALLDGSDRASLLSGTLGLFSELASDLEQVGDPDMRRTIRRATEARNRLVSYSVPDAEIPLVCDVLKACAQVLARNRPAADAKSVQQPLTAALRTTALSVAPPLASRVSLGDLPPPGLEDATAPSMGPPMAPPSADGDTGPADDESRAPAPAGLTLANDLALRLSAAAHNEAGTAHVRRLHSLLLEVLDDATLEVEHKRLRTLGYRGVLSDCLLESCAHENPLDVAMHLLSGQHLRRVLVALEVSHQPADAPRRLATRLLTHLGFPVPVEATDPHLLRTQLLVMRSEVRRLDRAGLTGRVASVSADVEQLLRHYVRFLCLGILGEPPEAWLSRTEPGRPDTLEKMTLGRLARAAGDVGAEIDSSNDSTVRSRAAAVTGSQRTVGRRAWVPGQLHAAGRLRNNLVHGKDADQSARALAELRDEADEFLGLVDKALERLAEGAFPKVVVIEEVTVDSWGRRRVSGRTPAGHHEEIFTDETLESGETYLMRAQTNPLRVDPILVSASRDSDESTP